MSELKKYFNNELNEAKNEYLKSKKSCIKNLHYMRSYLTAVRNDYTDKPGGYKKIEKYQKEYDEIMDTSEKLLILIQQGKIDEII